MPNRSAPGSALFIGTTLFASDSGSLAILSSPSRNRFASPSVHSRPRLGWPVLGGRPQEQEGRADQILPGEIRVRACENIGETVAVHVPGGRGRPTRSNDESGP